MNTTPLKFVAVSLAVATAVLSTWCFWEVKHGRNEVRDARRVLQIYRERLRKASEDSRCCAHGMALDISRNVATGSR